MEDLPGLGHLRTALEFLLTGENDPALRQGVVEDICATVAGELRAQGLSDGNWDYLEPHAFAVQGRITNPQIRAARDGRLKALRIEFFVLRRSLYGPYNGWDTPALPLPTKAIPPSLIPITATIPRVTQSSA